MEYRKEIIALTSEASKLEVSAFLESKGDTVYRANFWDPFFPSLFFDEKSQKWLSGSSLRFPPTISLEDFLAQNTTIDEKPKEDKERELLEAFITFRQQNNFFGKHAIELFLASKRFSLTFIDCVKTDPEYFLMPDIKAEAEKLFLDMAWPVMNSTILVNFLRMPEEHKIHLLASIKEKRPDLFEFKPEETK